MQDEIRRTWSASPIETSYPAHLNSVRTFRGSIAVLLSRALRLPVSRPPADYTHEQNPWQTSAVCPRAGPQAAQSRCLFRTPQLSARCDPNALPQELVLTTLPFR